MKNIYVTLIFFCFNFITAEAQVSAINSPVSVSMPKQWKNNDTLTDRITEILKKKYPEYTSFQYCFGCKRNYPGIEITVDSITVINSETVRIQAPVNEVSRYGTDRYYYYQYVTQYMYFLNAVFSQDKKMPVMKSHILSENYPLIGEARKDFKLESLISNNGMANPRDVDSYVNNHSYMLKVNESDAFADAAAKLKAKD